MVKDLYMKTAPQGAEAEPQSCGAAVAFTRDLFRRHPLWAELRYPARCPRPVSYTHLDVYKRQEFGFVGPEQADYSPAQLEAVLIHLPAGYFAAL